MLMQHSHSLRNALASRADVLQASTVAFVALAVTTAILPPIHELLYGALYVVVLVAALVAGIEAGAIALILSAAAAVVLQMPGRASSFAEIPNFGHFVVFVTCTAAMVAVVGVYQHAVARAREKDAIARERLIELEALYREAAAGLALLSPDLKIVRINPPLAAMAGIIPERALGRGLAEVFPELAPAMLPAIDEMKRTGHAVSNRDIAGMHHGMAGVRCWLQDFYPVKDKDGRLIAIGTILRDITERARDVAALKRAQARNEMLVREVHHRIKNNLQIIVSMVQAHMREQQGENSVMEDLLTRVRATARLSGYLHLSADLERVKICGLIRQICGDIEKSIGLGAPIHFMSVGEVAITSDKALSIALTVNELVTNAMKHARRKHAAVQVACTAMADGLSIRIQDEGGGLPADFQLQGGHTFGLQMVKGMVSQLGGTLSAASDTGGAVFALTIPLSTRMTISATGQQELAEETTHEAGFRGGAFVEGG